MKKQQSKQKRQERVSKNKRERMGGKGKEREYAPLAISELQRFGGGTRAGRKSWRFSNRELVCTVEGSVAFATTGFEINPGLAGSFPWLAGQASEWEQYRFHRLRYRYVPRCPTTTAGSVLLSPDYNVVDSGPTSELEAADTYGSVESSVWGSFQTDLDVSCMNPFGGRKLVRNAVVAGDMNLYDSGLMYISTIGEANTDAIGKLWVDYEIEFFIPQNSPPDELYPSRISQAELRNGAWGLNRDSATLIGFDDFAQGYNPLRVAWDAAGTFTPKKGCYKVTAQVSTNNSVLEQTILTLELRRSFVYIFAMADNGGTSVTKPFICLTGIVSVNGSETVSVWAKMTCATGTVTAVDDKCFINFEPA